MMKRYRIAVVALMAVMLVGIFAFAGCTDQGTSQDNSSTSNETVTQPETHDPVELQIYAANSLSSAMEDIESLYKDDHDWVSFADTQYKSSGELNQMLAAGGYADILISASKGKMDDAATAGYIDPSTRFDMFTNDLVMVTAENSTITSCTLDDIAAGKYTVAVGDESVPAGNYACQSLNTIGCYSDPSGLGGQFTGALAEDGKVVLDSSVGNVCKHAEAGEVDIAFVYTSDVFRFGGVKVVGTVPNDTHQPIIYPAAVCADSTNADEASAFLNWAYTDPQAIKVWQQWGFELV